MRFDALSIFNGAGKVVAERQKAGKIFTAELAETAEKGRKIVGWLRQKTANDKKQAKYYFIL